MYYLEAYKLTRTFPIALEKYLWATWSTELSKYIQYTYNEVLIYATKFSKHYTFMSMCIYIHFLLSKEKKSLNKMQEALSLQLDTDRTTSNSGDVLPHNHSLL